MKMRKWMTCCSLWKQERGEWQDDPVECPKAVCFPDGDVIAEEILPDIHAKAGKHRARGGDGGMKSGQVHEKMTPRNKAERDKR